MGLARGKSLQRAAEMSQTGPAIDGWSQLEEAAGDLPAGAVGPADRPGRLLSLLVTAPKPVRTRRLDVAR
jgi:hypothetical protein